MKIKYDEIAEAEDLINTFTSYMTDLGYSENATNEPVAKTFVLRTEIENQNGYLALISKDGEYLDDVVVNIQYYSIGNGGYYRILTETEHYYGCCVEELKKDLAEIF